MSLYFNGTAWRYIAEGNCCFPFFSQIIRDFARDGVHLNRRGVVALEELYLRMVASSSGDKDVDQ
jgi:hypothetical protein